ncbi:MAG: DUF4845 domain-containing protein [gamma proteobacterium symbiont of Bathyaustriella thionipta]|nr:DUF4845 domain-containing protein [gamma proteobacterium symbiont of Bathyaustriella thionipta]
MKNMLCPKRQSGMTGIGWLIIIILIISAALLVMTILPKYITAYSVESSLQSLVNDPSMRGASKRAIRDKLSRKFRAGYVTGVDLKKDLHIEKSRAGTLVDITYENREHIVGNIDIILSFSYQVNIPR